MRPTLADIRRARERIASVALRTPLVRLNAEADGAWIWLKLENLQPIGSFKIRGATNAMANMAPEQLARGVYTASAGNMAQGVAWCARERGIPCTVIAPQAAPATKLRAIERLGARVIPVPFERWWKIFQDREFPGVEGTFIHAFDDPDVMAGNGTIGLEIAEDLADVDTVVVPWGGGGLACGIASAMRALLPGCRVLTAEAETGAPFAASHAAGSPQTVEHRPSFVDGIGSRTVLPRMFELARGLVDGALTATLPEIGAAIALLAERNRVVAEGAGACALACALAGRAGRGRIVCIVSGGNIDADRLAALLAGEARVTPASVTAVH